MALTTVTNTLTFNLTTTPKRFDYSDTTDYAGQGINTSNVTVNVSITDPTGFTIFNGTVTTGVATNNICQIPLDTNSNPVQGTYTITATHTVDATTLDPSYDVSLEKSIIYTYSNPTVDLDMSVNCITPLLSSVDNTSYTYGAITPTITRSHSIHYPPSLGIADVTGTGMTLSTSTFYTQTTTPLPYSSSITSTLSYNLTNGFYISNSVTGSGYINVTCDGQVCDLYCCLKTQYNRWVNNVNNGTVAAIELAKFGKMINITSMIGFALQCSISNNVSDMVAQVLELGNCEAGCGCGDDTPQLVTGLGTGGSAVIVEAGSGITVSSVTEGSTTTYTVSMDSALLSKLNALTNTVVAAGTGISVASVTVGDTTTYTITSTVTEPSILTAIYLIDLTQNAVPSISLVSYKKYGSTFNVPVSGTLVNDNNGSGAAFQEAINSFTFSSFLYAGSGNYYPVVEFLESYRLDPTGNPTPLPLATSLRDIDLQVYEIGVDDLKLRFVDKDGNPIQGYHLNYNYDKVKISINITA